MSDLSDTMVNTKGLVECLMPGELVTRTLWTTIGSSSMNSEDVLVSGPVKADAEMSASL